MNKMYILVRKDLGSIYKMVQGAHALAQYMLDIPNDWNNQTIVFLEVTNKIHLFNYLLKLQDAEKQFSTFHEPDINNELTAIACYDDG